MKPLRTLLLALPTILLASTIWLCTSCRTAATSTLSEAATSTMEREAVSATDSLVADELLMFMTACTVLSIDTVQVEFFPPDSLRPTRASPRLIRFSGVKSESATTTFLRRLEAAESRRTENLAEHSATSEARAAESHTESTSSTPLSRTVCFVLAIAIAAILAGLMSIFLRYFS